MKIKTLILRGIADAVLPFSDIFKTTEYDVYQVTGTDLAKLPMVTSTLCPDLILCEERLLEALFGMEDRLPKTLPFIFFGVGQAAPQLQLTNRPVAHLTAPFRFGVLDAVAKLMIDSEVSH
ncbi:hypothetical protein [Runella sp.]|uniref:hypothetical protein n=1 Tax=Runella sp. TaxID=1960881 RepID=UPI003D0E36E2